MSSEDSYFHTLLGENATFYAKSTWIEDDIHVTVLHETMAYSFTIDKEFLKKCEETLRINNIGEWTEEAFKTSSENFKFDLSDDLKTLTWRKVGGDEKSAMKIRIGKIPIMKINFVDAQKEILEFNISNYSDLSKKHKSLQSRYNSLRDDQKNSRIILKELQEAKGKQEKSLYEQFLPILQSKQDKIKELSERIATLEKSGAIAKTSSGAAAENDDDDEVVEVMDDDSYGSGTDVDDPKEEAGEKPKRDNNSSRISVDSQNFLDL